MEEKLNGNFKIIKYENNIFKIEFRYSCYSLINSLLKTRIIQGGSTDDMYKTITFKAISVKSLYEYQMDKKQIQGKKNLLISELAKAVRSLSMQLNYLIEKDNNTFIGYNPEDIIVINNDIFISLSDELITSINSDKMITISVPFSIKDFLVSPELLVIKEIPSYVHFKTTYFSLALLLIYMLLGDDEFYNDYIKSNNSENIIKFLDAHHIRNTRLYWLLSRCLVEDAKNRNILLI